MASRRTTIYDLADLAGTSPSAVSSVLNGTWEKRRIGRKTAERVLALAQEHGYARNIQASLLRSGRSNILGMIIPKYDNRYFGAIAERFESLARARGLFPVITCTQRDPTLELDAARELVSYQVYALLATGATDPDKVAEICGAAGVRTINLDLPGSAAPSVISDNRGGARDLTRALLARCRTDLGYRGPLLFVGGRARDHNTAERIAGFVEAHGEAGIDVPPNLISADGYAAGRAQVALEELAGSLPPGIFVNSTITLEGVIRWLTERGDLARGTIRFGCFDWDPFGALLPGNVGMMRQDVEAMLDRVFQLLEADRPALETILVPCIFDRIP